MESVLKLWSRKLILRWKFTVFKTSMLFKVTFTSRYLKFQTRQFVNQSICLSGQKILATIFVMKTQAENITKYSEVKRQTDHGQTELSNMLVKKNVLNEINKEGTFTQGFKDCRKIKRKVSQNLDDLQNLLIKLTVKASS